MSEASNDEVLSIHERRRIGAHVREGREGLTWLDLVKREPDTADFYCKLAGEIMCAGDRERAPLLLHAPMPCACMRLPTIRVLLPGHCRTTPVRAADGYTYESMAIRLWYADHQGVSPITREAVSEDLVDREDLAIAIRRVLMMSVYGSTCAYIAPCV